MRLNDCDNLLRALRRLPSTVEFDRKPAGPGLPHVVVVASGNRFQVHASTPDRLVLVLTRAPASGAYDPHDGRPAPYLLAPLSQAGHLALVSVDELHWLLYRNPSEADPSATAEWLWLERVQVREGVEP